jgi:hypothetical protein
VIRHLKGRGRRPGVFCPLSPQSFADQGVLDELVGFLKANEDAAAGMVIEISQAASVPCRRRAWRGWHGWPNSGRRCR